MEVRTQDLRGKVSNDARHACDDLGAVARYDFAYFCIRQHDFLLLKNDSDLSKNSYS